MQNCQPTASGPSYRLSSHVARHSGLPSGFEVVMWLEGLTTHMGPLSQTTVGPPGSNKDPGILLPYGPGAIKPLARHTTMP